MDLHWVWWIAAVCVVALELSTGTVYLLMVAIGLAAGGVATWAGQSFNTQLLIAAAIAAGGCGWVHRRKKQSPEQGDSQRNHDVQIDLGNLITVDAWHADGTALVQYRGAQWTAKLDAGGVAASGTHSIVAMQGNSLLLKPVYR
jgi:membrane protein implicated in regulation of membrane protease activity